MARQKMGVRGNQRTGGPAVPAEGRANSHPSAGTHPGETDRMVGGSQRAETGMDSPRYLPGKRGRR